MPPQVHNMVKEFIKHNKLLHFRYSKFAIYNTNRCKKIFIIIIIHKLKCSNSTLHCSIFWLSSWHLWCFTTLSCGVVVQPAVVVHVQ